MAADDLDRQIDPATKQLLDRFGFDRRTFERLRARLVAGASARENRLTAALAPPAPDDVQPLPPPDTRERAALAERGRSLLASGQVAAVVLAGGMATRFGGVVKAAVEVLEGQSFLALKLRDVDRLGRSVGRCIPVYAMTSFATHDEVTRMAERWSAEWSTVRTFAQFISLRLDEQGELFRDRAGALSPYAPGHGDLVPALRRAGVLAELRRSGVRHLFMSNVDNLAATLDPAVIAAHAERGAQLTFEVAALRPGDKGGVPARVEGKLQVIEAMRYPEGFDERTIPLFSTNSFVFDVEAIDREFELDCFQVTKQVEGRPAVQFERLVNQVTAFVQARGLAIERDGLAGRFLPVKDPPDLEARRPEIAAVLEARGVLD